MIYPKRSYYFFILFFACTSVCSQPVDWPAAPKRIIWFAAEHNSFGDGATSESPIDVSTAGKLDRALQKLSIEGGLYGEGLVLSFLSGNYEIHGIRLRPRWHLIGAGIGKTNFKLVPAARHRKIKSAYHSAIAGGWGPQFKTGPDGVRLNERDFDNIRIANISLDCNWNGMKKALGPILKKVSGIDLLVRQALVERVQVSRFGAIGGRPSWREVFPIRVISSMGDGASLPGYLNTLVEIRHCIVEGSVLGPSDGTEWPYCTGIMVSHKDADPENFVVRARVHHNEIRNIVNGIAFGGAFLHRAEFFANKITNCGIGFNFDTGSNRNVIIRDNQFLACVGGGSVNNGKYFEIRNNNYLLKAPAESRFDYWHNGLRLWDHTRGFVVENNRFEYVGKSKTTSRGVILHGINVGFRMFQDDFGKWQRQIDPHYFKNNHYVGLLPNLAGPQEANQIMYFNIGERSVQVTGVDGVSEGIQFFWSDD